MLSKKLTSYILESIAWPVRPTLMYGYYLPEKKVLVSTDAFRLHEVSIDLWDKPLYLLKSWELVDNLATKFIDYQNFFPTEENVPSSPYIFSLEALTQAKHFSKYNNYNAMFRFKEHRIEISHIDPRVNVNIDIVPHPNPPEDIYLCSEYILGALKHYDKTGKDTIPVRMQSKNHLAPLILHGTIEGHNVRTLIMPLIMPLKY